MWPVLPAGESLTEAMWSSTRMSSWDVQPDLTLSSNITAAPSQSKFSRINQERVSQRGFLEEGFGEFRKNLLEREEVGMFSVRMGRTRGQCRNCQCSLQETDLAQTGRVCPGLKGQTSKGCLGHLNEEGRCYRTGIKGPPMGSGSSPHSPCPTCHDV